MSEVRNAHWENHSKVLIGGLQKQLQQSELCDCTIVAEGQSLKAHKVILSACSPYFKSLFLQSRDKDVFVLHREIKFRELKSLIEFVYYGDLLFSDDTIEELLLAAEILQIRGLQGRSKTCFQSTKQVIEEKCPTEYYKKVRLDYQKDQKTSSHFITTFDGFVPKKEKEWIECNEYEPQETEPAHSDTRVAPQESGRDPFTLTTQQEVTNQTSNVREEQTSHPENRNRIARGNKRKISQEICVQPQNFSEFSVILQDVWKERIFQRDNEGHLTISGIRCDFHPLESSSKNKQSKPHDIAACESKVNVNMNTEDLTISNAHRESPFQQNNCSDQIHSVCSDSNALLSHTTNHVRTRGLDNKHTCFECGKDFKCAFNLENHLWSHAVDRPYVCNICGKAFSVKGNYKHHVFLHSNERPYVCQGCGKSFKVVASLQSHYRQHCGRHS